MSRNYKKVPLILLLQIQILLLSVFLTGKGSYLNKINSFCKLSDVSVGDASFKVVCFVPKKANNTVMIKLTNPLHHTISMHTLQTIFQAFPKVLTRRVLFKI